MRKFYFYESPQLRTQRYITKEEFKEHLHRSGNYVEEYSGIPIRNISKPDFKPNLSCWATCNDLYQLPSYVDDIHTKTTHKSIYSPY